MEDKNLWSRRKFSKAALSLQVIIDTGLLNIPIGCAPKEDSKEGVILETSLQNILKLALNEIIPKSGEMPSASEVGVAEYILDILKENLDLISAFKQVLTKLNIQSKDSTNTNFVSLDSKKRIAVLKQYENAQPELFMVLKDFVYEGYYINEKVWKLIGYEPYPTVSAGPAMEPFDEKLLNRVKQIPPIYITPKS